MIRPRIVLIHAVAVAIDPVLDAFRRLWPEAECVNLLEDSLSPDRARDGDLTPAMIRRIEDLVRYAENIDGQGVLFTCSAFGEAIERAARAASVPVLKPNEAMFAAALRQGTRIGMLATFEPSVASMEDEFRAMQAPGEAEARIETICVPEAMSALRAGDADRHNALLAEAAPRLGPCDVILLAHFSTSRAEEAVRRAVDRPVLTSPGSAVALLRALIERAPDGPKATPREPRAVGPTAITAGLVRRQGAETDGRDITPSRAEEIAREVDRLNRIVSGVSRRGLAVLGDPAAFSAILEAWRDSWPNESAYRRLTEIAPAIGTGENTSESVTRACLDRIAAWQPHINAFISIEADRALADAMRADRELREGLSRGPLHGEPLAHKDIFTRGALPTTAGSSIYQSDPHGEVATVLRRLEAAGAISLGTLNLSEFAAYSTGENRHWGDCANPWSADRIAGGSSSGSAAAVAAGLVFGSLCTDTGGSIRTPAAFCGVTGLKTTPGLVSRHGLIPRAWSLDTVGIMAQSALDCALLLDAVAGPDPLDPTTSPIRPPSYVAALGEERLGRIGVVAAALDDDLDPEIAEAIGRAVEVLGSLGGLEAVDWPDTTELSGLADVVMKSEAAAIHGRWMVDRPDDYAPPVFRLNEAGFHLPASRYVEALSARAPLAARFMARAFAKADVLCLPATPIPAPTFTAVRTGDPDEIARFLARLTRFVRPFNYLGLPALALPCGATAGGLPIGLQLVGRPFGEARLLAIADAFQQRTGWHLRRPHLRGEDPHEPKTEGR